MNTHEYFDLTTSKKKLAWRLQEIADLTGLSLSFLRKLERGGQLVTRTVGRCKIVLAEDLDALLRGGKINEK